ncbi:MAG: ATP-binding protein [Bacteroidetes bacterium]|nr:ATP-binding protein [Bacteroidota bacterium]
MEDLSLHILDIAENSLNAGAQNIRVLLIEKNETLILEIDDDGKGMNEDILSKANNPFFTTKEGKKIGLGLAFLSQAAEETGGNLKIERRTEKGIRIIACFNKNNIDMKPLGDIKKTMRVLKASHPEVNFVFEHIVEQGDPA